MRKVVVGSFIGFVLAAGFLAACGGGGGASVFATIGQAIDVVFDNSASGMTATNAQGAIDELDGRVDVLETQGVSLSTRVTALEAQTHTAATTPYSNGTSGLTATNVQAALDELAALGGSGGGSGEHVFVRWGNKNAPTGTTLLYSGIGVAFPNGGAVVMKGGDPGTSTTEGSNGLMLTTENTASRMPPGVTGGRQIVGAVCYSAKPTAIIYGTHTAPSGWSVLYKGHVMADGQGVVICVDGDAFDASTSTSETTLTLVGGRLTNSTDTTNFPNNRFVRAAVIAKD